MLLLLTALVFADVALPRDPHGTDPVLRIEYTKRRSGEDPAIVEATITEYRLVAPDGKILWRRPPGTLPSVLVIEKHDLGAYARVPRAPLTNIGFPLVELRANDIVVVRDGQLFALARKDGRTLFTATVGEAGFGSLNGAHADVTLGKCVRRKVAPPVLVECENAAVYWWSMGLSAFTTNPWQASGSTMFHDVNAPNPQTHDYSFDLGGTQVRIKPVE
jgi:hypothetical protein